jgi:hypothetical protein
MNENQYKLGDYHPVYLWAGPGTIRMNRLKFMQVPVNEKIHYEAHQPIGADIIVNQMHQNWIHLTYCWGFAPEIEAQDWESFRLAAATYHDLDTKVFAYIQSSNCVFEGSNTARKWYARDPKGRKFYYYTNRFMTCLQNKEWIDFLKERIKGAIDSKADGIFFDNLWNGTQPSGLAGSWLGSAGCYCENCQKRFFAEFGKQIPDFINPKDDIVVTYLEWRATQLTSFFNELADYARSIKPDIVISANDYDVIMRPSKLIYGIDFTSYSDIQDVMMIENFCLPKWEPKKRNRFPNNALTIRTARSKLPENKPLSVLSYDVGIGFDDVYPTRRILQSMAEITALGACFTAKGTEYFNGNEMTLITAPEYQKQQQGIGTFIDWLSLNAGLFVDRKNIAPLALVDPGEELWINWFQISPIFFGCMQTLTKVGIPWKVINGSSIDPETSVLLTFTKLDRQYISVDHQPSIIHVPELKYWKPKPESFLNRHRIINRLISTIIEGLIRTYHSKPFFRKVFDWFGMAKLITQTQLFFMPEDHRQKELIEAIPSVLFPKIESQEPVLINVWRQKDLHTQIHLVNYSDQPQTISVYFGKKVNGEIIFPGSEKKELIRNSDTVSLKIDIYVIILIAEQKE